MIEKRIFIPRKAALADREISRGHKFMLMMEAIQLLWVGLVQKIGRGG